VICTWDRVLFLACRGLPHQRCHVAGSMHVWRSWKLVRVKRIS
jgi:hypothetical protein